MLTEYFRKFNLDATIPLVQNNENYLTLMEIMCTVAITLMWTDRRRQINYCLPTLKAFKYIQKVTSRTKWFCWEAHNESDVIEEFCLTRHLSAAKYISPPPSPHQATSSARILSLLRIVTSDGKRTVFFPRKLSD